VPATRPRSFRFSAHELDRIERLADHLGASQREVIAVATLLLEEKLGLRRQAGVELAERLAREHGDQALIVVTLRHDKQDGYYATVTVAGHEVDGLEAWITMAIGEISGRAQLQAATLHVRDDQGINYLIGTLDEGPAAGDHISVTVAELPNLVVQRCVGRTDRELAENLKMDMRLRRLLTGPVGANDDEEEQ
jgi:hypothetical protein